MKYTIESKNMLAKLMATENINIVHQKIYTAAFDMKTRTLYCPIWQDMSNELRDLLLGHETGHALETPAEGWHGAISDKGRNYKAFLNVVEDARIEKKIKRRYPGLKNSFRIGYQELINRDFFEIRGRDINTLPFIDRLNLYTKGGVNLGIKFNDQENVLVNEVLSCETWDDVVRVTNSVYDYSKNEQYELKSQTYKFAFQEGEESDDLDQDYDSNSDFDFDFDDQDAETQPQKSDSKSESNEKSDETGEGNSQSGVATDEENEEGNLNSETDEKVSNTNTADNEEKEEASEEKSDSYNRNKESKNHSSVPDDFEPVCQTDDAFRKNETSLVKNNASDIHYMNIPKPILKNIIVPYKKVQSKLTEFYSSYDLVRDVNEFTKRNERYVSLLAKEFEMRKAASKFAKSKVSDTGDIDVGKIYKYQVDENIFKKVTRVPKGKSHGLILLLDYSGSMSYNLASSIEQILVLSMFCRKVNIPFVVYSFGNSEDSRYSDFGSRTLNSFQRNNNDIAFSDVSLREYMSSKMNNQEYKTAIRNMIALRNSFKNSRFGRPRCESLSNTPLNEAIVALQPVTIDFRKSNNLDIVNLVVVHDGDADYTNSFWVNGYSKSVHNEIIIDDQKTKQRFSVGYQSDYQDQMRSGFFDWYRETTGAKIFGFFLMKDRNQARHTLTSRYRDKNGNNILGKKEYDRNEIYGVRRSDEVKNMLEELYKNKFAISYSKGYNAFFLIPGGNDLEIDDGEFEIQGKVTVSKLKTAFSKFNKKRQLNRVLATKFIEGIAV